MHRLQIFLKQLRLSSRWRLGWPQPRGKGRRRGLSGGDSGCPAPRTLGVERERRRLVPGERGERATPAEFGSP